MTTLPESIAHFLDAPRIAVAGASRDPKQPANAILRRLQASGHEVIPVNPNAREVDGLRCYPEIAAIPEPVQAVMIATHPDASPAIVRQCAEAGVTSVWFHRSFGTGSISGEALDACRSHDIDCILGGCPLMFCEPVDWAHRCMRWWLQRKGRVPV